MMFILCLFAPTFPTAPAVPTVTPLLPIQRATAPVSVRQDSQDSEPEV